MANSKKVKNVLVTGGTGFIGSNICKYLVDSGHHVTVFDNNSRGNLKRLKDLKNSIKFFKGDIRDKNRLRKSFNKIDTVIHLAYINGTKNFYEKPIEVLDVGIKGIFNILEISKEKKIKEFYLASSSEVYQKPNKIPTNENEILKVPDIFNPRYSYGSGKIISELLSIYFAKKFFKKLVIFRPHNIYSEDMGQGHVIPNFINKIKNSKKYFSIKGSGNEIRSFMYITDFIQSFDLIFRKGRNLQVYNLGTNEKIRIKDLANLLLKKLNKKLKVRNLKSFKGNTPIRCPDIRKIRKLGFRQKIKLKQGLDIVLKYNKLK